MSLWTKVLNNVSGNYIYNRENIVKGGLYMPGKPAQDLTGEIHGIWKVIERDFHPISKSHDTFWKCECQ